METSTRVNKTMDWRAGNSCVCLSPPIAYGDQTFNVCDKHA